MAHHSINGALKTLIGFLATVLAVYIVGPPLYWHISEGMASFRSEGICQPCICDCPSESFAAFPSGLVNDSFADCGKNDMEANDESEKSYTDLLVEELKLQEIVTAENQQRADVALLEAKKMASQYQKEAEKCNSGMDTCEEARERAEAALSAEKRQSALWEQRARQMGWKDEMAHSEINQTTTAQSVETG